MRALEILRIWGKEARAYWITSARTTYDALGRAYRSSNPYRPWQSESAVWMTTTFDALGRTLTATTPDNAVVTTSYSGNTVTATDQAGKKRKSATDALGRMTKQIERVELLGGSVGTSRHVVVHRYGQPGARPKA